MVGSKSAKEELLNSEEFNRTLLDNITDRVCAKNADGRYILMNKACYDFLGAPVGTAIGKTDVEIHGEELGGKIAAKDRILMETTRPYTLEKEMRDGNGREVLLSVAKAPIKDGDGKIVGVMGICRDITYARRVERALEESEERLRFIAETTGDVIYRLKYDTMRYDCMNPAIEILTGYSPEEINAMGFSKLVKKIETAGEETASKARIVSNREEGRTREYRADYLIRTKGGKLRWVRDHSFPWMDGSSKLVGSVGILSDIDDRKRAEEALRESEERYRTIFDHSPLGVMHFDKNGAVADCNDKFLEIFGCSREKTVGFPIVESLGDENFRFAVEQALSDGVGCCEGDCHAPPEGEPRTVRSVLSRISSKKNRFTGGVCISEDITERRQTRKALQESEKQLRRLSSQLLAIHEKERERIANDIHDSLGQSLHVAKAGLENLIQRSKENKPPSPGMLREIKKAIEFSIEEMRNIYMDLRPSLLDDLGILATIRWFFREFRTLNPEIHLTARISVCENETPEPLKIVIFRTIQSALENIASHSKCSSAAVFLGMKNGKLELMIEDNGLGFDPLDRISGEPETGGIGLACMQERVESSGGTFTFKSAKGQGTTIRAWWASPVS